VTTRSPGQRAGLTREALLAGAGDLLREEGLESLTMRALGTRLGVTPKALYSHVAGKDALIDHLLDQTLIEVRQPPVDAKDPIDGLQTVMASTYRVLLTHPDLVPLYLARQGAHGPNAHRLGAIITVLLAEAGVQGHAQQEALRVLIGYTIGFAAFAVRPESGSEVDGQSSGSRPRANVMLLNFTAGLQWLLTGIVRDWSTPDRR
jgi:TetR/AcrR family tetracycline transcriptional repressor